MERLRRRWRKREGAWPGSDDVGAVVAALRAFAPPAAEVRGRGRGASSPTCASAATTPCASTRSPRRRRAAGSLRGAAGAAAARRSRRSRRRCARRSSWRPPTCAPTTSARRARSWRETLPQGQVVGQEIVPLAVAGLYVPGGLADYPSSVLMTAIPAQVAGVERVVVCSPPRRGRRRGRRASPPPARCSASTTSYPIGGAQAVAALAFGTARRPALRRHRRPRQRLRHRGQAPGDGAGRHRRARRPQRGAGGRRRDGRPGAGWPPTCSPRPSTAPAPWRASPTSAARWSRAVARSGRGAGRGAAASPTTTSPSSPAPTRAAAVALVQRLRPRAPRAAPRATPPTLVAARPQRRRRLRRAVRRDRLRRLRRRQQPRAAHRRRGALRPGPLRGRSSRSAWLW